MAAHETLLTDHSLYPHVMGQSKAGDGASSTPGTPGTPSASRLSLGSLTSALSRGQGPGSPSTNVPAGARIAGDPTMYEGVDAVSPTELLLTLPPPILRLIVLAAPILRYLATFFLVVLWKHPKSPWASWLLVFLWWGATLGGEVALRYGGINFAVAGWLTYGWARNIRRRRKQKQAKKEGKYGGKMGKPTVGPMTATPTTLVNTLVEAQILADCLNDFAPHWAALSNTYNWTNRTVSREVIFFSISSLPFILTLNYFVELRYTFCAIGTIVLTWKAPWLIVLRGLLWRSKLIRGTLRLIVAIMLRVGSGFMKEWKRGSGKEVGLLDAIFVKRGEGVFEDETKSPEARRENFKDAAMKAKDSRSGGTEGEIVATKGGDIEFSFTVYENQRWWVGLDWTSALLPSERPAWSDASQHPVAPPASFSLPPPTISYLTDRKSKKHRMKRTVEWQWIDAEWEIRKASPPTGPVGVGISTRHIGKAAGTNVKPSPKVPPPAAGGRSPLKRTQSVEEELEERLSQFSKDDDDDHSSNPDEDAELHAERVIGIASTEDEDGKGWDVDAQGWQYGDNHWEKMGSKGAFGKYTRRRAWTRRAIIIETLERIPLATAAYSSQSQPTAADAVTRGSEAIGGDEAKSTALKEHAAETTATKRLQSAGYDHEEIS